MAELKEIQEHIELHRPNLRKIKSSIPRVGSGGSPNFPVETWL